MLARDADELAQQVAKGEVRRGRLVFLALDREHRDSLPGRAKLLDQPRLAHPRLGDELDDPALVAARHVEGFDQHRQLVFPTHERRRGGPLLQAERGADGVRLHQLCLALGLERLERHRVEPRPRPLQHIVCREQLSRLCLGHQPRREIDRVALYRVGPSIGRAEVADEDTSPADADAERQRAPGVQHCPHRTQHPLLVVPTRAGRARHQHHLAAARCDVGLEERHLVVVGGPLNAAHDEVECTGEGIGPLFGEQLVCAHEVDEGGGHRPMLGLATAGDEVLPDVQG